MHAAGIVRALRSQYGFIPSNAPAARRIQGGPFQPVPGGKREAHYRRTGHMQVPYLEDPNTGTRLLESTRILDYLDSTYAV